MMPLKDGKVNMRFNMKHSVVALGLILSGCAAVPWVQPRPASEASAVSCTEACEAHYAQCPQVFAAFPQRSALECPAAHRQCLRMCEGAPSAAAAAPAPTRTAPAAVRAVSAKEAKLRELKHFHDAGLVSDEVYIDRQKAILAEP